ncbi:MAG: IS630 family transposase, partial [Desulfobacteraceae bacterium]|nr:IS630 family transposase [Desulfobacteraceae bacterium]
MVPSVPYAWQKIGERIELPSFRSKTLNLFGIWDAKKDLHLYSSENSLRSETIVAFVDDFIKTLSKPTVIIFDNAPVHKGKLFK